jgi:hypothetical protein
MFMDRRVFFEIGEGELKQGGGGLGPAFLHVNKRAGQLNQAFVKGTVRTVFVLEPQMLQYLMGLVKKLAVETFKKAEVMRIECLPVMGSDHFGNAFALAHRFSLKFKLQSLKPKVTSRASTFDIGLEASNFM